MAMEEPMLTLAANASALNLVDFIKPILMLLLLGVYLRALGSILERDLRYFNLNIAMWNTIFLVTACLALVAVLAIPIFWAGFPAMIVILLAPLLAYWKHRNDAVQDESQKFTLSSMSMSDRLDARKSRSNQRAAAAVLSGPKGDLQVPADDDPLKPIHMAMEDLLLPALEARASRLELGLTKKGGAASQIVDSVRYKREPLPTDSAKNIIDYLKKAAGMDVEENRKLQRAKFGIRIKNATRNTTLHATTSGSSQGILFRLDFNRDQQLDRDYEDLGLEAEQEAILQPSVELENRHGVILVGSAPGQGLSTSLCCLLQRHDAYTTNIKTLERDVQRMIEGVDHSEFDPAGAEVDFPTQLRSIIRRGPDIIMVSDLKDPATAVQASLPGRDDSSPLIYIGIPTKDGARGVVSDWLRANGDSKDTDAMKKAVSPLLAVVTGRILRKLCTNCRTPFNPTAEQAKKLGIKDPANTQLYRQSGRIQVKNKIEECPTCGGTGFLGTIGVFEVMPVDRDARKLLVNGDFKGAYTHARRSLGMMLMQEAALRKVARGETSLEEVARVLSPEKAGAPTSKSVGAAAG
ncbi:MAG: ATPase, T2SS/T4P/T4SS family [Phycisphaerales bacterium]|jgi:type II secretory ATPase GspE/PulE/Tfp pilus assembly ATPase PilB-like protein|nr:ATPase, T2SS/T4P/T4SS family [Phycisphaerales bacterium]